MTMNDSDRQILDHFTHTRGQTIELARWVPEDLLTRTADGEDHPLGWLFLHIPDGVDWWMHHVMRDGGPWPPGYKRDKDSVIAALGASRDRLVSFFDAADGTPMAQTFTFDDPHEDTGRWVGRERVLYLTDHEVHHRGKIVLALRQWGRSDYPTLL